MAPDDACVVSVEHMQKVSRDEVSALKESMSIEWKSVLTKPEDVHKREYQSLSNKAYWAPGTANKVRWVQSELESLAHVSASTGPGLG